MWTLAAGVLRYVAVVAEDLEAFLGVAVSPEPQVHLSARAYAGLSAMRCSIVIHMVDRKKRLSPFAATTALAAVSGYDIATNGRVVRRRLRRHLVPIGCVVRMHTITAVCLPSVPPVARPVKLR